MRTVALLLRVSIAVAQTDKNKTGPKGKLVKGSELVGAKLFDQKSEHIGEIDDVLFDENTGGMTHAIVSVGGWLGIGDKETAVPWKFVHQSKKDTPGYVLEIDRRNCVTRATSRSRTGRTSTKPGIKKTTRTTA